MDNNIIEWLRNKARKHETSLNNIAQQKMDKGEIKVSDINKNYGLIDETYLSDTLKAQMAGTASIGSTPPDESITPAKTIFLKAGGKNLFNKNIISLNESVSSTTGVTTTLADYFTTDYIRVVPNTQYARSHEHTLAYYDVNKTFISGVSGSANLFTFTTPANCYYIRSTAQVSALDALQIELGATATIYEPHYFKIAGLKSEPDISSVEKKHIKIGTVTVDRTDFAKMGKNLFDKSTISDGYYVNQDSGILQGGGTSIYFASDYIDVAESVQYFISAIPSFTPRIAFYNSAKVYISGIYTGFTNPFTTPVGTAYMRFSADKTTKDSLQLEQSAVATTYENFGYKFIKSTEINAVSVEMSLPDKIYGLVGQELNIYYDNIMNDKDTKYDFDVTCDIGMQYEKFFRVLPTTAGNYPISIKVYDNGVEKFEITSTIIIKGVTVGNGVTKSMLVIGDSTTASNTALTKLYESFIADVMNLTLIGTKGVAPIKHEGLSGWKASKFYTEAESPFVFSGVFNFSQYMTTNALATPDYVVINLGINDVFDANAGDIASKSETILTQYQGMIDSIKAYNANIKIGLCLTIPPNYSQDPFGKSYFNGVTRWRCKKNNFEFVKALITRFKGKEGLGIYLIPLNVNIDTKNNYAFENEQINARNTTMVLVPTAHSGVHPAESGYWQIADTYWYWLKSFES
jgi:lysophospholipase L1-like esterase